MVSKPEPDLSAYKHLYTVSHSHDIPSTPLPLLAGSIPLDLKGTFYRVSPCLLYPGAAQDNNPTPKRTAKRLQNYNKKTPAGDSKVEHWFDGDGGVVAVSFGGGGGTSDDVPPASPTFRLRLIRTAAFLNERSLGRRLYTALKGVRGKPPFEKAGDYPTPYLR